MKFVVDSIILITFGKSVFPPSVSVTTDPSPPQETVNRAIIRSEVVSARTLNIDNHHFTYEVYFEVYLVRPYDLLIICVKA